MMTENEKQQNKADHVLLTETPIDIGELSRSVYDDAAGAVSTFIGTTRNYFKVDGQMKKVVSLHYESFREMAEKEVHKLIKQVRSLYPDLLHVTIHHRLGSCPVGQESVFIAVSSPHRKESLSAVHFLIDELKATVPIWKKEIYDDGTCSWKQNSECKGCHRSIATTKTNENNQKNTVVKSNQRPFSDVIRNENDSSKTFHKRLLEE